MKVGDVVKYKNLHGHCSGGKFISKTWIGLVVETGIYAGNCDLLIMWNETGLCPEKRRSLEVISENRRFSKV